MNIHKYLKKSQDHFKEVVRLKTSPHSIALGFAIGTFIAILPTPGFSIILGILIVALFKRVNKFTLFGAFIVWNPLVMIGIYPLTYTIGNKLMSTPVTTLEVAMWDHVYNYTIRYLLGGTILAITLSFLSYFVVKWIAQTQQEK